MPRSFPHYCSKNSSVSENTHRRRDWRLRGERRIPGLSGCCETEKMRCGCCEVEKRPEICGCCEAMWTMTGGMRADLEVAAGGVLCRREKNRELPSSPFLFGGSPAVCSPKKGSLSRARKGEKQQLKN
ncbi:hypothetical protein SLEP1_g53563 [Rubroshorea leprosula]|uniref:Uncharacterized protein n=1 Tax=Rubroshorea leprosula TaxID=152421 RepID=A0AAV5MAM9_9ROSI|nr:hypothetical protein SLEP1_g53563 [Rubroshorea leprosula]